MASDLPPVDTIVQSVVVATLIDNTALILEMSGLAGSLVARVTRVDVATGRIVPYE